MGSGKSTLGQQVAARAGFHYVDLDEVIETNTGETVAALFTKNGEEYFRVLEHEILRRVTDVKDTVISLGGGTPCFFDHMTLLNKAGITIYLKYPPEILFRHLKEEPDKRPLISGKTDDELLDYIIRTLKKREPFYARAKHILTYPDISVKIICETVRL